MFFFFKLKTKLTKSEITSYLESVSEPDSLLVFVPFLGFYRRNKKNVNPNTEYLGSVFEDYFQLRRYGIDEKGKSIAMGIGVSGFLSEHMNRTEIIFWVRPIFELFIYFIFFAAISYFAFIKLVPSIFDSKQQIFSLIIVTLFLFLWGWVLLNLYKMYKIEKAHWKTVFEDVLDLISLRSQ